MGIGDLRTTHNGGGGRLGKRNNNPRVLAHSHRVGLFCFARDFPAGDRTKKGRRPSRHKDQDMKRSYREFYRAAAREREWR
jgi:hypothetical protein